MYPGSVLFHPKWNAEATFSAPQSRKRTKEIQPTRRSGFPQTLRLPGALSLTLPLPPPRSSESRSETLQRTDGAGPGGRGCQREEGGGTDRFLKYCLLSSKAWREACDLRPLTRPARRRGQPDGLAAAPGYARGDPERSNPFWAWGTGE